METNDSLTKTSEHNNKNNLIEINKDKNRKNLLDSNSIDNIIKNDENWAEDIKKYYNNKKILKWGRNPKPKIITNKIVKSQELLLNPITQKYSNTKFESELKNQEKLNLKDSIAKGYDNELRIVQTYDIINLKDRLEVLKNHPNYPQENFKNSNKPKYKKIKISSGERDYNILSNIELNLHHYDKPENRPFINPKIKIEKKINNENIIQYKDYDILSNKYKHYNDEKFNIDKQLSLINSSKKFFKSRDYDAVKGQYFDKDKEIKYQEEMKIKNDKLRNAKRDSIFNPFNNEIYDKGKYEELNQRMKNKILRFYLKPKIENYYHLQELKKDEQKSHSMRTKLDYKRFKEADKRGYDILNGNDNFNHYKNSVNCRNEQRPWELIKNGVNENQTLDIKKMNICRDSEDINQRYKDNKIQRVNILKNLPKIENEKKFQLVNPPHKISLALLNRSKSEIFNHRYSISENSSNFMPKNLWFSGEKSQNLNLNK